MAGRPHHVSSATWALLSVGAGLAGLAVSAVFDAALGGAIIGAAPFIGLMAALADRPSDFREPTRDERITLMRAEDLTGHRELVRVKLPRSRRAWVEAAMLGFGVFVTLVVIGIAAT